MNLFFRRLFACCLAFSAVAAHAQISPYWQVKIDDPLAWNSSLGRADAAGNYYLASVMSFDGGTGYFRLTKFSPSGQILWKRDQFKSSIMNGQVDQMLFTQAGGVLVGAQYEVESSSWLEIYHYSANGDLVWTKPGGEMKLDSNGTLFVMNSLDDHDALGAKVRRIEVPTGVQQEEEIGDGSQGYQTRVTGWSPDNQGRVLLSGETAKVDDPPVGFLYTFDFSVPYKVPPPAGYSLPVSLLERRPNGELYVQWYDPNAKLNHLGRILPNMTPDWDIPLAARQSVVRARLDPSQNLLATIQTINPEFTATYELRKYSPTGALLWSRSLGSSYEYLAIWDGSGNMFFRQGNKLYKFLPNMASGWANPIDLTGAGDGLSRDSAGFFYFGGAYSVWNGNEFTAYFLETKYGPSSNAAFITQNVPSSMIAGQTYSVSVILKNTGVSTWTLGNNFYLRSINPTDNNVWSKRRVDLSPSESILPGQTKKFSFTVYAPTTGGTYNFQWRMSQGSSVFGEPSGYLGIPVVVKKHAARYVSQTLPTSVKAGSTFNVTVTMKNVGTNTWTAAGGYGIAPAPTYPTWSVTKVSLAAGDSIAPGQSKTFTIPCKAPTTPGTYQVRWQMRRDAPAFTGFFGDRTTLKSITVTP